MSSTDLIRMPMSPIDLARVILFESYDSLEPSAQRRLGDDLDSVRQRIQNDIENSHHHDIELAEDDHVGDFKILFTVLLEINDRKIEIEKRFEVNDKIWNFIIETNAKFKESKRDSERCKTNSNRIFIPDKEGDNSVDDEVIDIDVPAKMKEAAANHRCSNGAHVDSRLECFNTTDKFEKIVAGIHTDLTASLYAEVIDPEGPSVDEKIEQLRQLLRSMIATGDVLLAEAEALDTSTPESGISYSEFVQAAELGHKQASVIYET